MLLCDISLIPRLLPCLHKNTNPKLSFFTHNIHNVGVVWERGWHDTWMLLCNDPSDCTVSSYLTYLKVTTFVGTTMRCFWRMAKKHNILCPLTLSICTVIVYRTLEFSNPISFPCTCKTWLYLHTSCCHLKVLAVPLSEYNSSLGF